MEQPKTESEEAAGTVCPSCGEVAEIDAKFCEACGQDLNVEPLPACVACGELAVGKEGYCEFCGHKQPAERDHKKFEKGSVFAGTDRGKRHRNNEDAVAIGEIDGAAILVVCDGVSSTAGSAEASLAAVRQARDVLVQRVDGSSSEDAVAAALGNAAEAAQREAAGAEVPTGEPASPHADDGPPSSTFVAVVAQILEDGVRLSTAWLGDSRAYWLGAEPTQLSIDHEVQGSLTRWIGADSEDSVPEISQTLVGNDGMLVVCSDGLWRYADDASAMKATVDSLVSEGNGGLALVSALIDFANDGGGHDNISVALWSPPSNITEEE